MSRCGLPYPSRTPVLPNPGRQTPKKADIISGVLAISSPFAWAARMGARARARIGADPSNHLSDVEHSVGALVFLGARLVGAPWLTTLAAVVSNGKPRGSLQSDNLIPSAAWIYVNEESGSSFLWQCLCEAAEDATETEAFRPYVHSPHIAGKALSAVEEIIAQHEAEGLRQTLEEGETDVGEDEEERQ